MITELWSRRTFGGWPRREAAHRDELGTVWTSCGVDSETAPLLKVVVARPRHGLGRADDPDDHLMVARPRLTAMQRQARSLAAAFQAAGADVAWCESRVPRPNFVFLRDLFFMTPEGAVVARPASSVRAGEEREVARALAELGVPLLGGFRGEETFEGADALWLSPTSVIVGVGVRTNAAGFRRITAVLRELRVDATAVTLDAPAQHLLGTMNLVAPGLAVVVADAVPGPAVCLLREHGIDTIDFQLDDEVALRRGLNFVAVAPNQVVMPAGAPRTAARLVEAGVQTINVDVGEYLRAGGGIACAVGILHRTAVANGGGTP